MVEDDMTSDPSQDVRLLCWIMTGPSSHKTKVFSRPSSPFLPQAAHVKATWGRRCDKLLFMSSQADLELPTVALGVQDGRDHLWHKTREVGDSHKKMQISRNFNYNIFFL